MRFLKAILLTSGVLLVAWGYQRLAVPPDTPPDEMLLRAKDGMASVVFGGTCLMLWLVKQ